MDDVIGIERVRIALMIDTDTEKTFQVRSRLKLMTLGLKGKEIARKMRKEFPTVSAAATDVGQSKGG